MRSRLLVGIWSVLSLAAACAPVASSSSSTDGDVTEVKLALTTVPTGIQCLRATVTIGSTTVTPPLVTLTPGSSSASLSLGQQAAGAATFNAQAFNVACASVTSSTVATWIADPAMATLAPGVVSTVALTFRKNNAVTISSNFLDNVQAIATGFGGSYALMADGTVKAWGATGAAVSRTPTDVAGLTNVVQIAGGQGFTCVRKADFSVWCWGQNNSGVLGPGVPLGNTTATPQRIMNLGFVQDLSAGADFACAITQGEVYCWGENGRGQLGIGNTVDQSLPISGLPGIGNARVFTGMSHTCVLRSDGKVYCWGWNLWGQIGDGTTTDRLTPFNVLGLNDTVDMALGNGQSCAQRGDGLVRCWGFNQFGQVGDNTFTNKPTPTAVSGLTDAAQIVAGLNFTCARRVGGTVSCWGDGVGLGDGVGDPRAVPAAVSGLSSVAQVRAHVGNHACAELSDRTFKCWGDNGSGAIGDGTNVFASKPTAVALQ
jgi:alpha-tubulin suppressor-like RCC1 family protein